ncbi:hypothetical protein CICLE_v10010242mg [Citrus x clementina]|uniref:Solute carrier family 40 protein n=1 Tax=Citrus clementina TaxID=85681 RepID=V4UI23_CITCL|nr:hypothetical protein CICLE_v10010242mg [Citrus x clementina]
MWLVLILAFFFFSEIVAWLLESSALLVNPCPSSGRTAESAEYKPLPGKQTRNLQKVTILENIRWKELGFLSFIRLAYLVPQIAKNHTATFSSAYQVLNSLHVPVSVGVFLYEAIGLYEGLRVIASKGEESRNCSLQQLAQWCACGIVAGLLGIDADSLWDLYSWSSWPSAAATFGMTFSPSMSVVEFYLPNGFPVPYALYFIAVAFIAAFTGTYIMNNMIDKTGRKSLITFDIH